MEVRSAFFWDFT